MKKIIFVMFKIVIILFIIYIFHLKNINVKAVCSDPACEVTGSSGPFCTTDFFLKINCDRIDWGDPNSCTSPSSDCFFKSSGNQDPSICGGCNDPNFPQCAWFTLWTTACGTCCACTGSDCTLPTSGPTPTPQADRIVGRVAIVDLNGNQTYMDGDIQGYSISSSDGAGARWGGNGDPNWYQIGRWWGGTPVSITFNNPPAGYLYSWGYSYYTTGNTLLLDGSGSGTTANIIIHSGSKSGDWNNHLWFYLTQLPACKIKSITNTTVEIGQQASIKADVIPYSGNTVVNTVFHPINTFIANMVPANAPSYTYTNFTSFSTETLVSATVAGIKVGQTNIAVTAYLSNGSSCTESSIDPGYANGRVLVIQQPPSCTASLLPSSLNMVVGSNQVMLANCNNLNPPGAWIDDIHFESDNSSIVSLNPLLLSASPYNSTATANNPGTTNLHVKFHLSASGFVHIECSTCVATANANISAPGPWWQVRDGDVLSKGSLAGSVASAPIPCSGTNCYFMLTGPGGFSGIPIFGTTAYFGRDSTGKTPSALGWLSNSATTYSQYDPADSGFTTKIPYGYNFIKSLAPQCIFYQNLCAGNKGYYPNNQVISNGTLTSAYASGNFSWIYIDGDASINPINKLKSGDAFVVIVKGNLTIANKINLTDGKSFIAFIVGGNIIIDPTLGDNSCTVANYTDITDSGTCNPNLEGIFMADGTISTGTSSSAADLQLRVRGMLLGWSGINLQRDLKDPGNRNMPSEFIQFAPDLQFNYPSQLQVSPLQWKEVAP